MPKLGKGEREVLEFIVEHFSNYKLGPNETIRDWIDNAKLKLKEDDEYEQ